MRDLGLVALDEPVTRLFPQGMVHKDGEVMSKSKGNTIAPDDVIARYGADTLRLYILFAGPPELAMEWSETGIEGPHRFLLRVWRLVDRHAEALAQEPAAAPVPADLPPAARDLRRKVHQTIDKVTRDIEERIQLNTAVAALMELVNEIYRLEAEVSAGPGPPGAARGPRDARPPPEPLHPARVRGDVGAAGPRGGPRPRLVARLRRRGGPRGHGRAGRAGQRQGAGPRGGPAGRVRGARSGRRPSRSPAWPSTSWGSRWSSSWSCPAASSAWW